MILGAGRLRPRLRLRDSTGCQRQHKRRRYNWVERRAPLTTVRSGVLRAWRFHLRGFFADRAPAPLAFFCRPSPARCSSAESTAMGSLAGNVSASASSSSRSSAAWGSLGAVRGDLPSFAARFFVFMQRPFRSGSQSPPSVMRYPTSPVHRQRQHSPHESRSDV